MDNASHKYRFKVRDSKEKGFKGSRVQPLGPLDQVELLKRLPLGSRIVEL
jgi:hypothetical protein